MSLSFVIVFALSPDKSRVLCDAALGNVWHLRPKYGESYPKTVQREFKERLGFQIPTDRIKGFTPYFEDYEVTNLMNQQMKVEKAKQYPMGIKFTQQEYDELSKHEKVKFLPFDEIKKEIPNLTDDLEMLDH